MFLLFILFFCMNLRAKLSARAIRPVPSKEQNPCKIVPSCKSVFLQRWPFVQIYLWAILCPRAKMASCNFVHSCNYVPSCNFDCDPFNYLKTCQSLLYCLLHQGIIFFFNNLYVFKNVHFILKVLKIFLELA